MKRNSKSKSVATYTQRLCRSQNSTWKEPAIRSSKIIQIPTPQQSFVDDDDDDDNDDDLSDATGEYIIVASHVGSSQSEFIDDGSVADQIITEEVTVEDTTPQDGADEHAYKSVATSYSGKLFKDFPVEVCSLSPNRPFQVPNLFFSAIVLFLTLDFLILIRLA